MKLQNRCVAALFSARKLVRAELLACRTMRSKIMDSYRCISLHSAKWVRLITGGDTTALTQNTERTYASLRELSKAQLGQHIGFTARISNSRVQSALFDYILSQGRADKRTAAKLAFFELRQDGWPPASVQALFTKQEAVVSKQMIKFATSLPTETLVYVEGVVQEPAPDAETGKREVRSTTVSDVEIKVSKVRSPAALPFVDCEKLAQCFVAVPWKRGEIPFQRNSRFEGQPESDPPRPVAALDTRMTNRVFDLRV